MKKLIPLKLRCKLCGKDLADPGRLVDGMSGVHLKLKTEKGGGDIWLSSLYGSYNLETTVFMRDGEIVTLSCPHCNMLLPESRTCTKCGAPMVFLSLHLDQGDVQICRRKGCKNHYIEFSDFEKMKDFYELYNQYFRPGP